MEFLARIVIVLCPLLLRFGAFEGPQLGPLKVERKFLASVADQE